MCGICGIIHPNNNISKTKKSAIVQRMNEAILHRGPDEDGFFADDFCALAMRRLSIIDLSTGKQPIYNETQDICVFFNGELYNFQELKEPLLAKGHIFKTNSDTEVLVHLYEEFGEQMFLKLKGMFAFCLYDFKKRTFYLARDRFGEKPLFYHFQNGIFSFSSELKSLLENRNIPRELNKDALPYYLRTSLVPENLTFFKNIDSLPPGHFIKISNKDFKVKPYFNLKYNINKNLKTDQDAIDFVKPILEKAVQRQTISDVPIGAFLSGGIDSSTVVALLQKNSAKKIKTFNVRFEDEAFDESPIARKVAEFCGTEHHEIVVPNFDFDETLFWKIIDHVGEPFRDSSAIPTYFITNEIRKNVKVALSGDGGDELFGGYAMFQWYQKILGLKNLPKPVRQLGNFGLNLMQNLPILGNASKIRQIKRAAQTSLLSENEIPIALNEFFSEEQVTVTFEGNRYLDKLKAYPAHIQNLSPLRKIMYYRTAHTLPKNMLIKVDRMSMANSLEVRAPFLDADLFEAAAQLPDKFLIRGGKGKYLIREIMKKELPSEVFNHPKKGFSIPLFKYQNEAFKKLAKRLLFEENPMPDLFPKSFLETIYHQGIHHRKNTAQLSVFQSAHRLWMMMMLFGWMRRFEVS